MSSTYPGKSKGTGRSKSPVSNRPGSKKKSTKKLAAVKSIVRDDDETMLSMLSAYTNSLNRFESSPRARSPGREDASERLLLFKSQLTEALEENAFVKSRLNAELKERHVMEAKYKELNKKFIESKKALQATGAALLQVHNQTSELKNKRDEREIQLEESLALNRNLNSKIGELESRLEQAMLSNGGTGTTTANLKKLIEDKEALIKAMEEQQLQLQGQMSKIRRDNYRLGEENAELQEAVESKNRKIANLTKKTVLLEEELESATDAARRTAASRGGPIGQAPLPQQPLQGQPPQQRVFTPNGTAVRMPNGVVLGQNGIMPPINGTNNGNSVVIDPRLFESRLNNFEDEKKFLEERMAQLELSLKQSESFAQLMRTQSQDNSPSKASMQQQHQSVQPNTNLIQVQAIPPEKEKPSMTSPRRSPSMRSSSKKELIQQQHAAASAAVPVAQPASLAPIPNAPVQQQLPSLTTAATDALFSSSSVIEVNKVPSEVLDKPASAASTTKSSKSKKEKKSSSSTSAAAPATDQSSMPAAVAPAPVSVAPVTVVPTFSNPQPAPPVEVPSPAPTSEPAPSSAASSKRSTKIKKTKSSKEKGLTLSTADGTAPVVAQPSAPTPVAVPVKTSDAPVVTPAPVAPAPVEVAPVLKEPKESKAKEPKEAMESKEVKEPKETVEPSTDKDSTDAKVRAKSREKEDVTKSGNGSGNGSRAASRSGRSRPSEAGVTLVATHGEGADLRAPLSREGRSSTPNRRPSSKGKDAAAAEYEFPPSATIASKYTETLVDEMLKPDADVEVYKERMIELRKKVKRDIYAWTKSFVNETQRQPTKQERKDIGGQMFRAYSSIQRILKEMGVDGGAESTKLGRGASVKFNTDDL